MPRTGVRLGSRSGAAGLTLIFVRVAMLWIGPCAARQQDRL
jgi:hypothetical protein